MTNASAETSLESDLARWRLQAEQDARTARTRWASVSNLRLALAAAVVLAGFWWIRSGDGLWAVLATIPLIAFVAVLVWHHRLRLRRDHAEALAGAIMADQHRIQRNWADLPQPTWPQIPAEHPYAHDLDLSGRGSLVHLSDTTTTPSGREMLHSWLLAGAATDEIRRRQIVADGLVPERDWRAAVRVRGSVAGPGERNPDELLRWLEDAATRSVGVRQVVAVLAAVATIGTLVLNLFGVVPFAPVLALLAANAVISFSRPSADRLNSLNREQRSIRQYRAVLPLIEELPGESTETRNLRDRFAIHGTPAHRRLASLDRALALVIPPSTLLWLPLQLLLNWDVLVDLKINLVARQLDGRLRGWIEAIGEVEALSALATLKDLNPGWAWPILESSGSRLDATALGHPLIAPDRRVANNLSLGPAGTVLVVTGSNMAGKSTLLRSIGLNAVLARAGGPVCAASLAVPNQPIWSSVRIQDSLESGVSLFMAELLRLKAIVDAARSSPITYVLDEMLHGTNTSERRIAARIVIGHLLRTASIGAVSTHDLELVDADLGQHATLVHLVDTVHEGDDGPAMTFDYRVRPGLAPTSNALRLLRLAGLADAAD